MKILLQDNTLKINAHSLSFFFISKFFPCFSATLNPNANGNACSPCLKKKIGKNPKDLNGVLFLIGVQELGRGPDEFSKEQKQDLLHIATCKVLSRGGYYSLSGTDAEGWPHWKAEKPVPHLDLPQQERMLKMLIVEYFEKEYGWTV